MNWIELKSSFKGSKGNNKRVAYHCSQTTICTNKSCMNAPIKHFSSTLYHIELLFCQVVLIRCLQIENYVKSIVKVWHNCCRGKEEEKNIQFKQSLPFFKLFYLKCIFLMCRINSLDKPWRLKSSWMNSSSTSQKNSFPFFFQ